MVGSQLSFLLLLSLFLFVSLPFSASTPLFGYFCFLLSAAPLPLLPPCLSQSPTSTPASTPPLSLPSPPVPFFPALALPHLPPPTHATPPTPPLLPPLSLASSLVCGYLLFATSLQSPCLGHSLLRICFLLHLLHLCLLFLLLCLFFLLLHSFSLIFLHLCLLLYLILPRLLICSSSLLCLCNTNLYQVLVHHLVLVACYSTIGIILFANIILLWPSVPDRDFNLWAELLVSAFHVISIGIKLFIQNVCCHLGVLYSRNSF